MEYALNVEDISGRLIWTHKVELDGIAYVVVIVFGHRGLNRYEYT